MTPMPFVEAISLDKYYTRRDVALNLKRKAYGLLGRDRPSHVVEPSVGSGAFIEDGDGIVAFDLKPEWFGALEIDSTHPVFHNILREQMEGMGVEDVLAIGNPPFNRPDETGCDLALQFVNDFVDLGVVAFILPNLFRRWSMQRQVMPNARLIMDIDVPRYAFERPDGKPYEVGCCFQVWSTREVDRRRACSRLTSPPPATHPDFKMRRWNRQGDMERVFAGNWAFAIRCQGYGVDYHDFLEGGSRPTDKAHYILFEPHNPTAERRLRSINFEALAQSQTATPGFGATDVVRAYLATSSTRPVAATSPGPSPTVSAPCSRPLKNP